MTQRVGYFYLSAYVSNANWDVPATLVSPFDRSRHDRQDLHFGMGSALLVNITDSVGAMPAGSTLEDTLRYLMDWLIEKESINGSWFTMDAYSDENTFWRDLFTRTEADRLGRSTGLRTAFGDFDWQTLLQDGATVSVDGAEALLGGEEAAADFIGYPTMAQGELWFDFWFDPSATNPWKFSFQPSRDDITDLDFWVRARQILSTFYLEWGIGELGTQILAFSGDPRWMRLHATFGIPGDTARLNVTPVGFDEEPTLEVSGTVPDPNTGHRWLAVGGNAETTWSDDAVSWNESQPAVFGTDNLADLCWGMAFGIPTWMAVGSFSGVAYSRDAETWAIVTTAHTPSGTLPNFGTCATDGSGTWLACKLTETTPWRAIGDPATSFWNRQTTSLPHAIWTLGYGNGLFVAATSFGDIATSPDGGTWTNRTTGLDPDTDWIQTKTVYGNGRWVAIGGGGAGSNEFMSLVSTDGTTWTPHFITPSLDDYYGLGVGFGGGKFVSVGQVGLIVTSTDGLSWSLNDQGITDDLLAVAFTDGVWALTTINGDIYTATDPDGTWTLQTSGVPSALQAIVGRPERTGFGTPVWHFEQSESDLSHPIDNMKTVKVDADPPRLYRALFMDAEVTGPHFTLDAWVIARFTLNAVVKVARSSSFTIDAYVPFHNWTLDAWIKATRSGSFTLDAYVPSDHSGELGDFVLGDDELGGG